MSTNRPGHRARLSFVAILAAAGFALVVVATGSARSAAGPTNISEPTISGAAVTGEALQGNLGLWSSSKDISYKYQWLRCKPNPIDDSSSATCKNIPGATSKIYELNDNDLGFRIRFRVKASNSGGSTTATSAPTSIVVSPGGSPAVITPPTVSGSALVGETLRTTTGAWQGTQPITYQYRWLRCDKAGNACSEISGQQNATYKVKQADVAKTLRTRVIAKNSRGKGDAFSSHTGVVQDAGSGSGGIIVLPDGSKSVDVKDVTKGERLIVDNVKFSPNPVTAPNQTMVTQIRVKDSRGYVVRNAIVFIRSTPRVTTGGDNSPTGIDGWVTYQLSPIAGFPTKDGNLQFFVKAYRKGDPELGGISASRLVQMGINY